MRQFSDIQIDNNSTDEILHKAGFEAVTTKQLQMQTVASFLIAFNNGIGGLT